MASKIYTELLALENPEKVGLYTQFFRANKGDICYGDRFLAAKIPEIRKLVKKYYKQLDFKDLSEFLNSPYNEIRFFGQQVICQKYQKQDFLKAYNLLALNIKSINHWNLVDTVASTFADFAIKTQDLSDLRAFAVSTNFWARRIAIVACISFVKTSTFEEFVFWVFDQNKTYKHEYIQKALGWALRKMGKSSEQNLINYLKENWQILSPITKSYATEHLRKTLNIKILFCSQDS